VLYQDFERPEPCWYRFQMWLEIDDTQLICLGVEASSLPTDITSQIEGNSSAIKSSRRFSSERDDVQRDGRHQRVILGLLLQRRNTNEYIDN
jgi:hypothetical protein